MAAMALEFARVRTALRSQCATISRQLLNLSEQEFARPTRLRPWDVRHLAAHLYRDLERVPLALHEQGPVMPSADTDVVTYWDYDRTENAARTQARADLIVASYDTGAALARAFDGMQQRAVSMLDDMDPDVIVRTWAPVMRVDEFAATRVVEVAIHGLDLADALARSPETDDDALEITSDVLRRLLAEPLPPGLDWDVTTWIEKGSGRSPLTPVERAALGTLAAAFPLLA
jgi:uncharacterized protein (TIGR03083 family)